MAHEVETMFAVGSTPWHGLGTVVQQAPSIEEGLKLAGLDWQVDMVPLATPDGRIVTHRATVRSSDKRILGVVGPGYKVLQNAEAFEWARPLVDSGLVELHTAGSLREGERVWMLARIKGDPMEIVRGDLVERFILLSNGHDGKLACRVGFTPVRVVCANTLAMAHAKGASKLIRVLHTDAIHKTLDELREIMNLAASEFEATAEQYRSLAQRSCNLDDLAKYVKIVFRKDPPSGGNGEGSARMNGIEVVNPEMTDTSSEQTLGKILPLFESGRGNDMAGVRGTWWAAYNAVTEYISHERGQSADSRVDFAWHGPGVALNRKALEAASSLSMK